MPGEDGQRGRRQGGRVIDTTCGHFGGLGLDPVDNAFVDRTLRELLDRPA